MVKKFMRPKKVKKIIKKKEVATSIEKRPYTNEERVEKLRRDRITIAKRYEEMRLYDEAIQYYKKLGMTNDVERVAKIKKDVYLGKAIEFEQLGKFEDAIRLYENLKMNDRVEKLKKIIEDGTDSSSIPEKSIKNNKSDVISESNLGPDEEMDIELEDEDTTSESTALEPKISSHNENRTVNIRSPPPKLEEFGEPVKDYDLELEPINKKLEPRESSDSHEVLTQKVNAGKIFQICPYCGEELNLPKKPNFCPYCKEPFV